MPKAAANHDDIETSPDYRRGVGVAQARKNTRGKPERLADGNEK